MSRFFRRMLAGLVILPLIALTSCGGDDDGDDGGSQEATAARIAASQAALAVTGMVHGAAAVALSQPASNAPAGQFLGAYGLTCPDITVTPNGGIVTVKLDYGTGCASQLDGRTHSGSVQFALDIQAGTFAAVFTSYKVDNFSVGGTVTGTISGNSAMINIANMTLSRTGVSVAASGQVLLTVDVNGTPANMTDDSYSTLLGLTLYITTPDAPGTRGLMPTAASPAGTDWYSVYTSESHADPVVFKAGCRWPVSGLITVVREAPVYPQFQVDFGTGTCDDKATLLLPPDEDPITFTLGY